MANTTLYGPNGKALMGYDATVSSTRRGSPTSIIKGEDYVLSKSSRKKLVGTARDELRNYALVAWAIRKHLDYVSRFDLQVSNSLPDEVRARVINLFTWHGKAKNFDIAERHNRTVITRLFEMTKILDGDALLIKLKGGKIQAIEGSRIGLPTDLPKSYEGKVSDHGLVLDRYGKTLKYCICKRDGNSLVYDRLINADDVIYGGNFTRFDQTRGISPLSSAINSFKDVYELIDLNLIKAKLHALFGVAIYRDLASDDAYEAEDDDATTSGYAIDLSKPINVLDLDPGDKVQTIESGTPSQGVMDMSELVVRIALLSLDIPYTFFDSRKSSFSARIADRTEYEDSAKTKRDANRETLTEYSDWCIARWKAVPKMLGEVCDKHGLSHADLREAVEWIPNGTPWIDKLKEVGGDQMALANGLDSRQRICKKRGQDFYQLIDEQAQEIEYARSKGVPLVLGQPGQVDIESAIGNDDIEENQ